MEVISRVEPERRGDNETVPDLSIGVLNLNNCTKTILGTHVDCHGNVTVNQYLKCDGKDEPTKLKTLKKLLVKDSTKKYSWRNVLRLKALLLAIILATFIAGTIVGTSLLFKSYNSTDEQDDDLPPKNYSVRLQTRKDWYANEANESHHLTYRPAKFVIICHTGGFTCFEQIHCRIIVRGLQIQDMMSDYVDIAYNFLLGGDGYIYEGLGWGYQGHHTSGFNCASIGIAFLGDFNSQQPDRSMFDSLNLLLDEGVKLGEIKPDYKLFVQSQIDAYLLSPGACATEMIKKMKHYSQLTEDDLVCY